MGARRGIWINSYIELVCGDRQQYGADWRRVHGNLPGPNLCQATDLANPVVHRTAGRAETVAATSFGDGGC